MAPFASLLLALQPAAAAIGSPMPPAAWAMRSPGEIVAAAPAGEWVTIPTADLLVMDLDPTAIGARRRVVIQLAPAPFSRSWVDNVRRLAAAHWWDGTSVNRVQDNYVVQWGDATERKPLPPGLAVTAQADYDVAWTGLVAADPAAGRGRYDPAGGREGGRPMDVYADGVVFYRGWPVASETRPVDQGRRSWLPHCYGMVGVGRNLPPDAGSGAELYVVIGHAPRHLDRNVAVIGRVIDGIEHLSSLPRGTEALGFYKAAAERVPIRSLRPATELPEAERPRFQYLADGETFVRYRETRSNRRDPFFVRPAGAADICNLPVPVRRAP